MTAVNEAAFLPDADITPLGNDGIVAGGDGIARGLRTSGTRGPHICELSLTGLTPNRPIFDQAIGNPAFCEAAGLRRGGAQSFTKSWNGAIKLVASRNAALTRRQPFGVAP